MSNAKLVSWEKTFEQEADCCAESGDLLQFLRIEQDDGGGGPFWVIETSRWAIESIDDLVALLAAAGVPRSAPEMEPCP